MRKVLLTAADKLLWLYCAAGLIFLGLVVLTTFLQVATRYFLETSLSWTEEGARYSFIWMSMMGASLATRHGSNAAIDIIGDFLRGKAKAAHSILVQSSIIWAAAVIGVYGVSMAEVMMVRNSAALGIPMGYVYIAIPVGCAGIVVQCLANLAEMGKGGDC